jgi:hypothetical protein
VAAWRRTMGWLAGTAGAAALTASSLAAPGAASAANWSIQSPAVAVAGAGQALVAVSCASTSACLAVGDDVTLCSYVGLVCSVRPRAFAERWDGARWSVLAMVGGAAGSTSTLSDVSCASGTACIAVGAVRRRAGSLPLAERWNGAHWSVQPVRGAATGSTLLGVSCSFRTACMAVGSQGNQALAARWNGHRWTVRTPPGAELDAVSCPSRSSCFATGLANSASGCPMTLVDHWNGQRWSVAYRIDFGGCHFYVGRITGVSCLSGGFCAAVGYLCCGNYGPFPILAHWSRTSAKASVPHQDGEALVGISCVSANVCTAVGSANPNANAGSPQGTFLEQWNGTRWAIPPTPNPYGVGGGLESVSCVSVAACTAVGTFYTTAEVPFVESTIAGGASIDAAGG